MENLTGWRAPDPARYGFDTGEMEQAELASAIVSGKELARWFEREPHATIDKFCALSMRRELGLWCGNAG